MARKKGMCSMTIILIVILVILFATMMMSKKKEGFNNMREDFEQRRMGGSCGTCKVRNQG